MHRDDIRDKRSYFAALVRRRDAEQDAETVAALRAHCAPWAKDPAAHLELARRWLGDSA